MVADQVTWSGATGEKVTTEIPLEPCEALMPLGLPFANKHTLARSGGLIDDNFLCPNLEQDIHVQGSYFDAEFSYIRLRVLGCNE